MNYSVTMLDHMLTLGKIEWDSVFHISVTFCCRTRQAPNPRGLKTTTIYSVINSVQIICIMFTTKTQAQITLSIDDIL